MNRIYWTPFALRCLDDIYEYILEESKSETIAEKLVDRIFQRTSQLAEFPESGQEELFLKENGRQRRYLIEGFYKVVYAYDNILLEITIIDIFHTSQDPTKLKR